MRRILLILVFLFIAGQAAAAAEDPVTKLKDFTMAYFKPMTGKVLRVEGNKVFLTIGENEGVRPGMRLKILREGAPFIHPVTKEMLGKVESIVGKVEIKESKPESSYGVSVEGDAKEGDRVRLSETKIRVFFCQDKSIDWYLADDFYRKLKATDRIEMVDTSLESSDEEKVLAEAKKAGTEVAMIITAQEADKATLMRERLYWVSDGSKFVDTEIKVDAAFSKELKFGEEYFAPAVGEAVTMFDLPFGARFVASGDVDGDGKKEIILSTGKEVRAYLPGADLKLLWEVKGAGDNHLWMDTVDLNKDGKEALIVTSMKNDEVVSYIYASDGHGIKKLWDGKYFLRRLGDGLIAQAYSSAEGFSGDVFFVKWEGGFKQGGKVKLPKGVNIYDFVQLQGDEKQKYTFSYSDDGFLNLYDEAGTRVWRSAADNGGHLTTFKRQAVTTYAEPGSWSVKDRLVQRQREVLAVKRVPLAEMAKGFGYKKSQINDYWWNGFSMEEGVLIDGIKGSIQDYAVTGDEIIVLTSPFMGLKFGNILKGENPLGVVLFIYSVKGR